MVTVWMRSDGRSVTGSSRRLTSFSIASMPNAKSFSPQSRQAGFISPDTPTSITLNVGNAMPRFARCSAKVWAKLDGSAETWQMLPGLPSCKKVNL